MRGSFNVIESSAPLSDFATSGATDSAALATKRKPICQLFTMVSTALAAKFTTPAKKPCISAGKLFQIALIAPNAPTQNEICALMYVLPSLTIVSPMLRNCSPHPLVFSLIQSIAVPHADWMNDATTPSPSLMNDHTDNATSFSETRPSDVT